MIRFVPGETSDGFITYSALAAEAPIGFVRLMVLPEQEGDVAQVEALDAADDSICDGLVRSALANAQGKGAVWYRIAPDCGCRETLLRLGLAVTEKAAIEALFTKDCGTCVVK